MGPCILWYSKTLTHQPCICIPPWEPFLRITDPFHTLTILMSTDKLLRLIHKGSWLSDTCVRSNFCYQASRQYCISREWDFLWKKLWALDTVFYTLECNLYDLSNSKLKKIIIKISKYPFTDVNNNSTLLYLWKIKNIFLIFLLEVYISSCTYWTLSKNI